MFLTYVNKISNSSPRPILVQPYEGGVDILCVHIGQYGPKRKSWRRGEEEKKERRRNRSQCILVGGGNNVSRRRPR